MPENNVQPNQTAALVKPSPRPTGEVHLSVTLETAVALSENDVFNWMTTCSDADALTRLSRYAAKCAAGLRDPDDDDFRSRA